MKEAMLYKKIDETRLGCELCSHGCRIEEGRRGFCRVRLNQKGILYTEAYGRASSHGADPIEKKPLYHFFPGSLSYSIATLGCNFHCRFCQNWDISQALRQGASFWGRDLPPNEIVSMAERSGCHSVAYTYTEPTIFFEYAHDTALLARKAGLRNVFVTNGYMTSQALRTAQPWLDAANVDLKSMDDGFYRKWASAKLQPVLDTLKLMKELGIWVEVTTLVIPSLNDSEDNLRQTAGFIQQELGPATPWHVSRFFPAYDLDHLPPTPPEVLYRAREIGFEAGLRYVYTGNLPEPEGQITRCHYCGQVLMTRTGNTLATNRTVNGQCYHCGSRVDGVEIALTGAADRR